MTKTARAPGRKPVAAKLKNVEAANDRQQQADAPKPRGRRKAAAPVATAPAGSGRGRRKDSQQQSAALSGLDAARTHLSGSQGEGTSGKTGGANAASAGELRGGTRQVLIEEMVMDRRTGRPPRPEEYPFADLAPAKKDNLGIHGPSFFIADENNPKSQVATARKRHAPTVFWTRRMMGREDKKGPEVAGVRVWKAPKGAKARA